MPYSDLNKGRFSEPNRIYFITATTHQRRKIFNSFFASRALIQTMQQVQLKTSLQFLSWVVMPDHAHWLIQLGESHSLQEIMKSIKGKSAFKINQLHQTKGQIWQPNYYEHGLRKEEDVKQIARYIVANPLRAKLVEHIGDYSHWDSIYLSG